MARRYWSSASMGESEPGVALSTDVDAFEPLPVVSGLFVAMAVSNEE